jgi:hypothetical protein
MKKYFIFAATALVALTACSKVETEHATPDVKIGYQVATYLNQTKADSHGHTSFIDELTELGVSTKAFASKAYIHAAQADGTVAAPAAFFNAATNGIETISYTSGSPSTWEPAHVYYWPKASKSSLSFFSWYDYSGANPTITYTTDGGAASLAWADRTVALKDNVLYADAAYHYKSNTSPATHGLDGVSEGVPTLFHHALAKVRFTVKAKITEKADTKNSGYKTFWKVTLSDVTLSSGTIKSNGNLTLNQTSQTTANTQQAWTLPTNSVWAAPTAAQTYLTANLGNATGDIFDTAVAKGTDALTTTAVALTGTNFMADTYFTVLPQDVADNVTLTFKYTIETRYGNDTFDNATLVSTEVVDVKDLAGTESWYIAAGIKLNAIGTTPIARWQMNHRYVYNIIVNPETSTILYDPAVEDWAAEESAEVTVPNA